MSDGILGAGMSTGAITLGDCAARTRVLVVACSRCERNGQYGLDALINRYGRQYGVPMLLGKLSADCPERKSVSGYDLCGVHCPELAELFLGKPG
jgi:hypothetical protein